MTKQLAITFKVDVTKEVDGIEMGVLNDGTAYLTRHSLARLCGVAPGTIGYQREEWVAGKRSSKFAKALQQQGYDEPDLYIPVTHKNQDAHAYPEAVCMAFLEYFAFESGAQSGIALTNFRKLARAGMRMFIYTALGYAGPAVVPDVWQKFHDRVLLVSAPLGYFSVFKEIADFVVASIRGGMPVDEHSVPDISVGLAWSKFWADSEFDAEFGARQKHPHNYPDYFPQSASNPQEIWVYPVLALGEFRQWMQRTYVPEKFPKYLDTKVRKGLLAASTAEMLYLASVPPELVPPMLPSVTK